MQQVPFAIMSDFGAGSWCALHYPTTGTSFVNDTTLETSHELIEAYVDPYPGAPLPASSVPTKSATLVIAVAMTLAVSHG